MLEQIYEQYPDEDFLSADGLEDAIIGVEENSMRLIYSVSKIISILTERDTMTQEEAMEYYYYNIEDAYMGEKTPIYCNDLI